MAEVKDIVEIMAMRAKRSVVSVVMERMDFILMDVFPPKETTDERREEERGRKRVG